MKPFIVGFNDTIVRRRAGPGMRVRGEWVPGPVVETELAASVQPLALEDADIAGGAQLIERFKIFVSQPDALVAAFDESVADEVVIGTKTYTVEESRSWPSHTRATVVRVT